MNKLFMFIVLTFSICCFSESKDSVNGAIIIHKRKSADILPTLEEIKNTQDSPLKIQATGRREALEPIVNGKIHGLARYYHPNGQLYGTIKWVNGKKEGAHKIYREDGSLEQYLEYKDGQPNGIAIWLNDKNEILQFAEYFYGASLGSSFCKASVPFSKVELSTKGVRVAISENCLSQAVTKIENKIHPSFNCDLAKKVTEKAICNSERLASSDRMMNERYLSLRSSLSQLRQNELKASQIKWLMQREKCAEKQKESSIDDCILESMNARLKEIESMFVPSLAGATADLNWFASNCNIKTIINTDTKSKANKNTEEKYLDKKYLLKVCPECLSGLSPNHDQFACWIFKIGNKEKPEDILLLTAWNNVGLYEQEESSAFFVLNQKKPTSLSAKKIIGVGCREVSDHMINSVEINDHEFTFRQSEAEVCAYRIAPVHSYWKCKISDSLDCSFLKKVEEKEWCLSPDGNCDTE